MRKNAAPNDEIKVLEQERDRLSNRIAAIDMVLDALRGGAGTVGVVEAMLDRFSDGVAPRRRDTKIGEDRLEAIRKYMHRKRRARQADIAAELGYNSGTVSTGLDVLERAGEIRALPKENRSRVWELVG